jgi:hypothetical protein
MKTTRSIMPFGLGLVPYREWHTGCAYAKETTVKYV